MFVQADHIRSSDVFTVLAIACFVSISLLLFAPQIMLDFLSVLSSKISTNSLIDVPRPVPTK